VLTVVKNVIIRFGMLMTIYDSKKWLMIHKILENIRG